MKLNWIGRMDSFFYVYARNEYMYNTFARIYKKNNLCDRLGKCIFKYALWRYLSEG